MLILPPGHAKDVAERRPLARRERWFLGGGVVVLLAVVVGLVISFATASPRSGHGCVYVTVASSMGAQPVNGCGARARTLCVEAGEPGVFAGELRRELAAACRQAGLAVGRS